VKTSVFIATLCAGALATGADAADFVIKGIVNETLEASDNYFLVPKPSGTTGKTNTAAAFDFLALTPTTSYLLNTNYSYYKYFGPGAADAGGLTWGTPASATFRIEHLTELEKYNLAATWSRTDAAVTQLAQSGQATARGSINTYDVNGSVTHDLGRLDTITWTADWNTVSYSDPNSTPYQDMSSTIFWVHTFSPTTTFNASVNADFFNQDDTANSQRLMWRLNAGVQSQLTPRLSATGNFGWIFANAWQNGNAAASASTTTTTTVVPINPFIPSTSFIPPFTPLVGSGNGWVANGSLSYRLLKNTTVSLTAVRAVVPLFTGQLQLTESLAFSLGHQINSRSSLGLFAAYSEAATPGQIGQSTAAVSDFFSAGVNYAYQLNREWRTNLSYTFRDSITVAKSNTFLFSLTKDLNILGNPNPINQASAERARQRTQQTAGYVFPGFQ